MKIVKITLASTLLALAVASSPIAAFAESNSNPGCANDQMFDSSGRTGSCAEANQNSGVLGGQGY